MQLVLAVAEKGEVIFGHPFEQLFGLVFHCCIGARRPFLQRGNRFKHFAAHLRPVGDGGSDVSQHFVDFMFENIEDLLVGFFVDSEANERLVIATVRGIQHVLDPASGVPLNP